MVKCKTTLLLKKSTLAEEVCKWLFPMGTKSLRLYGLLKIHKEEFPLRCTVSNTSLDISLYLKDPEKKRPSMFPKSGAPMKTDTHSSKGALPPGTPHGVPSEREALFVEPSFIHHSKSPEYKPPPPPDSRFPSVIKGPLWREMPVSRAFLNISCRVSSKWALSRGPMHWASSERDTPFLEPHQPSVYVPGRWAPFYVPQRHPYGKRCPSPDPFLPILQGPQQGSPPSRFPSQSSHTDREMLHLQSPFQPTLKVPGRRTHSRLPNWAPMKRDAHLQNLPFITQGPQ